MDWSKIPDLLAIASLTCAFSAISRRNQTPQHRLWLTGWVMIAVHFFGFAFANLPGILGATGTIVGVDSLIAAGIFFMWATVPKESDVSCRRMATIVLASTTVYATLACRDGVPVWAFDLAAALISIGPLTVAVIHRRNHQHGLRWLTVTLQFLLGITLIAMRHLPGLNPDLGLDAILFTVYLGCCLYFLYTHRHISTGSTITVGGFFAWSMVFVVAPSMATFLPNFHLEDEVWNLPKYVVAVGMLLLLLEKQIERSQYLALHDDLTGLANRRLFQDRLSSSIERAKRSSACMALLQIDLDRFKEVNDLHGHYVGDLLLQHIGRALQARVRRSDTVARTGGDEFCVILEEPSSRIEAEHVAESLSNLLTETVELQGKTIHVGASIGISVFPEDAEDADKLCVEADLRMYKTKHNRRDVTREHGQGRYEHQDTRLIIG